jgi:hypothetical protein
MKKARLMAWLSTFSTYAAVLEERHRGDLLRFGDLFAFSRLRTIEQFDQCHRRIIAYAETEFQDTQIAARTGRETRAQHFEQLRHRATVTQAIEGEAAICQRRLLAQRDQGFDNFTQFFGFRQRGLDDFVLDQRIGHITQHSQTVAAGAVEFPQTMTVTHFNFLETEFWSSSSIAPETTCNARAGI